MWTRKRTALRATASRAEAEFIKCFLEIPEAPCNNILMELEKMLARFLAVALVLLFTALTSVTWARYDLLL